MIRTPELWSQLERSIRDAAVSLRTFRSTHRRRLALVALAITLPPFAALFHGSANGSDWVYTAGGTFVFVVSVPLALVAAWLLGVRFSAAGLIWTAALAYLVYVAFPASRLMYEAETHLVRDTTTGERLVALALWGEFALIVLAVWLVAHPTSAIRTMRVVTEQLKVSFSNAIGLAITLGASVVVLLSQDAWSVAHGLSTRNLVSFALFAAATAWIVHGRGSSLSWIERMLVMVAVAAVSYVVFTITGRVLVEDSVASGWLGIDVSLQYNPYSHDYYVDDDAVATLATARTHLSVLFTALVLITAADTERRARAGR